MSVIAHYYYRQQQRQAVSDKPAVATTVLPQPPAKESAAPPAGAESFQRTLAASQKQVIPQATLAQEPPLPPRTSLSARVAPTLEELVKFARAQGWSEKQIVLLKRLALRKNSRTGKPWNERTTPVMPASAKLPQVKNAERNAVNAGHIRGIRNNNPGNLEASERFEWLGQTGNDGRFVTFASPEHGIRALGVNLLAYHRRGVDTISKIISRWAPPQDNNDTGSYIHSVSQALGVSPHERLDMTAPAVLSALSKAIIRHENGTIPFAENVINRGVFSALGLDALPQGKQQAAAVSPAVKGRSVFALQAKTMDRAGLNTPRQTLSQRVQAATIVVGAGAEAMDTSIFSGRVVSSK